MSRRFQIAITESDRRKRRGIEKTSTDSEVRKPKRKTPDVVVAQNWTGKGAAANRGTLGERQLEIKKPPGASRKISDDAIVVLKQELETGEGFSSYGAIVEWLEKEHGQCIEYGTVYGWVRYRLGAKLKVPRPQSYKQDEMSACLKAVFSAVPGVVHSDQFTNMLRFIAPSVLVISKRKGGCVVLNWCVNPVTIVSFF